MATATPKLFYSRKDACQIPVWEIVAENGRRIYYERHHQEGYIPIGTLDTFQLGGRTCLVLDTVRQDLSNPPVILKEKDGYSAPMTWYEKDVIHNRRKVAQPVFSDDEQEN